MGSYAILLYSLFSFILFHSVLPLPVSLIAIEYFYCFFYIICDLFHFFSICFCEVFFIGYAVDFIFRHRTFCQNMFLCLHWFLTESASLVAVACSMIYFYWQHPGPYLNYGAALFSGQLWHVGLSFARDDALFHFQPVFDLRFLGGLSFYILLELFPVLCF